MTFVDETMDIEDDHAEELAYFMGRIVVQIDRVTRKEVPHPQLYPQDMSRPFAKPLSTLTFPKAVVKDRHIGHATV